MRVRALHSRHIPGTVAASRASLAPRLSRRLCGCAMRACVLLPPGAFVHARGAITIKYCCEIACNGHQQSQREKYYPTPPPHAARDARAPKLQSHPKTKLKLAVASNPCSRRRRRMAADDHGELLVQVAHETVAASEIMQRVVPHVPMTCGTAPASACTGLAADAADPRIRRLHHSCSPCMARTR